jgi:hypothetical protein
MKILKINNEKVEIYESSGTLIRAIGYGNAINSNINCDGSLIFNYYKIWKGRA